MQFNSAFWGLQGNDISDEVLEEGFYAYFSFNRTRDNYRKLIYNIYMNAIPFYGLQEKNSYNLEITKKR